jgi:hypothetical protein
MAEWLALPLPFFLISLWQTNNVVITLGDINILVLIDKAVHSSQGKVLFYKSSLTVLHCIDVIHSFSI